MIQLSKETIPHMAQFNSSRFALPNDSDYTTTGRWLGGKALSMSEGTNEPNRWDQESKGNVRLKQTHKIIYISISKNKYKRCILFSITDEKKNQLVRP